MIACTSNNCNIANSLPEDSGNPADVGGDTVPLPDNAAVVSRRRPPRTRVLPAPRRWTLPVLRWALGHPWEAACASRRRKPRRLRRYLEQRRRSLGHRYLNDALVCNIPWTSSPVEGKDIRPLSCLSGTLRGCHKGPTWRKLQGWNAAFYFSFLSKNGKR